MILQKVQQIYYVNLTVNYDSSNDDDYAHLSHIVEMSNVKRVENHLAVKALTSDSCSENDSIIEVRVNDHSVQTVEHHSVKRLHRPAFILDFETARV